MTNIGPESDARIKRILIVVGHYGSGKTEFAVNYALKTVDTGTFNRFALIDLDIANPYFRSREKQAFLESKGIEVFSNTFGFDINLDLPAISARINGPLKNTSYRVVVDTGGDHSGARILTQFKRQFFTQEWDLFCIINASRPETSTIQGALQHILAIEKETGLKITGLINNTHLLQETTLSDIVKGISLCNELSLNLNLPIIYHCCMKQFEKDVREYLLQNHKNQYSGKVFPLEIQMRKTWLDK